jgi:hypothetical protein
VSPDTCRCSLMPTICGIVEFCGQSGLVWSRVGLEDVVRFVAWLRSAHAARNEPNVMALPTVRSAGPDLAHDSVVAGVTVA